MKTYLEQLPSFAEKIKAIKETILTNIVFIGEVPAPTFHEQQRVAMFQERLAEYNVDECSTDAYNNPIGIIRGKSRTAPPIFLVAHLDTFADKDVDHTYTVASDTITGPGVLDNSAGAALLVSLPEILNKLEMEFDSDIVLAGVIHSLGRGNLQGIRHLLENWKTPIRGAVCVEGGEIGRLNFYSAGTRRCNIECKIETHITWEHTFRPNAILVLNDVINQIMKLKLPQRPRSRVIIGKIKGGFKHGIRAYEGTIGLEIQSDSDDMVQSLFADIQDIVDGIGHQYQLDMNLNVLSSINAAGLKFNHPLVKSATEVMKTLDLKPISEASGSELSIFLARHIPAVTLGLTSGANYHRNNAVMEIEPIYKGIAQILGVLKAIDSGVCDEQKLA
jgi:tripeptide aminopeptidase